MFHPWVLAAIYDWIHAVLHVSCVVSIFNCRQNAQVAKELFDLLGGTLHH